jgi:dephospho-CoA kinase
MIIGLTGTVGAGKGIVAQYFVKKGFVYLSLSDELRQKAAQLNIAITRQNLHTLGNKLRKECGKGILAEIVKEKILQNFYSCNVVVDGIRNPAEVEVLRSLSNFFLIAVDAPAEIRFERIKQRNREGDPTTWHDFLQLDASELQENDQTGHAILKCIYMADFHIRNDRNFASLFSELDLLFSKLKASINK